MRAVAAVSCQVALSIVMVVPPSAAHRDDVRRDQWYLAWLNVAEVHRENEGQGVLVAVVDTGVDAAHPDLRDNVVNGIDLVSGGSGDGRNDVDGHGTGMAALIAGHGHAPNSGVLGIAPKSRVLPVRISTQSAVGDTNDLARGIDWATDHHAQVICVPNTGGVTALLLNAVRRAQASNVVVVAAAGNRPELTGVAAPAAFPGVIAAAATDHEGNRAPSSVTGPEIVLAAPGVDIVSASRNGGYRDGTGTSGAAAIIAGAAALVRARYPNLSAEQVIRRLTDTADDRGPKGRDEQYGYGVLNLVKALTAPLTASASATASATPMVGPLPGSDRRSAAGLYGLLLLLLLTAAGASVTAATRRKRT